MKALAKLLIALFLLTSIFTLGGCALFHPLHGHDHECGHSQH